MSHYPQPIEWSRLRQRAVPPPFVVVKRARAHAATSAYSKAKELGWAKQQKRGMDEITDTKEEEEDVDETKLVKSLLRPSSRGQSGGSKQSLGFKGDAQQQQADSDDANEEETNTSETIEGVANA